MVMVPAWSSTLTSSISGLTLTKSSAAALAGFFSALRAYSMALWLKKSTAMIRMTKVETRRPAHPSPIHARADQPFLEGGSGGGELSGIGGEYPKAMPFDERKAEQP